MKLETRIEKIKQAIVALGPMRPGKLSLQRHGTGGEGASYYSASYTFRRKSRTDYVRGEDYLRVKEEIANYVRFKELCEELVALSLELSKSKNTPRAKKEE